MSKQFQFCQKIVSGQCNLTQLLYLNCCLSLPVLSQNGRKFARAYFSIAFFLFGFCYSNGTHLSEAEGQDWVGVSPSINIEIERNIFNITVGNLTTILVEHKNENAINHNLNQIFGEASHENSSHLPYLHTK